MHVITMSNSTFNKGVHMDRNANEMRLTLHVLLVQLQLLNDSAQRGQLLIVLGAEFMSDLLAGLFLLQCLRQSRTT